jgi:hypothetical protein
VVTRRRILAGLAASILAKPAFGSVTYYPGGLKVPPGPIPPSPQIHISYGQSWRSNDFASFGGFSIDPTGKNVDPLHVSSVGLPTLVPGPLPNGAGVNAGLYPRIDGITSYGSSDTVSIGRCAVVAQQILRANAALTVAPMLEFCAAYPGSTWTSGGGGGLQPGGTSWTNQLGIISKIAAQILGS